MQFYVFFKVSMFFGEVTIVFVDLISAGIVLRPNRIRSKRELIACTRDIAAASRIPESYLSEKASCAEIGLYLLAAHTPPTDSYPSCITITANSNNTFKLTYARILPSLCLLRTPCPSCSTTSNQLLLHLCSQP